jgi:hypothetical protein
MHRKNLVPFLCVPLMSLLATIIAPLHAQSLADLSRQEEQRRKMINRPAKVYTNKDLGQVPPSPSVPPPAAAAAGAAREAEKDKDSKEKSNDSAAGGARDRAYWSSRLKSLQSQLDRDQTYVDALQSRVNALTTDFVSSGDPAQRAVIERDRQKAIAELDKLKLAIVSDNKAIVDLEDEARRAGAPPGWLR